MEESVEMGGTTIKKGVEEERGRDCLKKESVVMNAFFCLFFL